MKKFASLSLIALFIAGCSSTVPVRGLVQDSDEKFTGEQ